MMMSQIRSQASAARRRAGGDKGFTLVELMVVVLVIAILLAIAIPTFLGARERSQDRAAQSNLRNALTAAKVAYSNDGDYTNAANTNLDSIEPRLNYNDESTASTGEKIISVANPVGTWSAVGGSGDCFDASNVLDASITTSAACGTANGTWLASGNYCSSTHGTSTMRHPSYVEQATCTVARWYWSGAVWSESETCWFISDNPEGAGSSIGGTLYGDGPSATACTGANASVTATAADW